MPGQCRQRIPGRGVVRTSPRTPLSMPSDASPSVCCLWYRGSTLTCCASYPSSPRRWSTSFVGCLGRRLLRGHPACRHDDLRHRLGAAFTQKDTLVAEEVRRAVAQVRPIGVGSSPPCKSHSTPPIADGQASWAPPMLRNGSEGRRVTALGVPKSSGIRSPEGCPPVPRW